MRELDEAILVNDKKELRYLIPEPVYGHNHPDVIFYTQYFTERAKKYGDVFANISTAFKNNRNLISAEKMAGLWSEFSRFVPSFIAKAVSLTTDPEHQHHLIQIAYDELGAQDKKLIHSKLFADALEKADINPKEITPQFSVGKILSSLNESLEKIKSPSGTIGLLLSFEIIAENNIETVFSALGIDSQREKILSDSVFFKVHRMDEVEHIRHSVANFLKFSQSEQDIKEAEEFFDVGIIFWKNFWDKIAELIVHE